MLVIHERFMDLMLVSGVFSCQLPGLDENCSLHMIHINELLDTLSVVMSLGNAITHISAQPSSSC